MKPGPVRRRKEPLKRGLEALVASAISTLRARGELDVESVPPVVIERTRDPRHGDFACPAALGLARAARLNPRDLAARIAAVLPPASDVKATAVAGPGFINFTMTEGAFQRIAAEIVDLDAPWGRSRRFAGRRVQVEFVSVNPTGPLHVGHGRGAACGAALANLLEAVGWEVEREYYVNDAGRQMDILTPQRLAALPGGDRLAGPPGIPRRGVPGGVHPGPLRGSSPGTRCPTGARPSPRSRPPRTTTGFSTPSSRRPAPLSGNATTRSSPTPCSPASWAGSATTSHVSGWCSIAGSPSASSSPQGAVPRVLEVLRERGEAYERDGALLVQRGRPRRREGPGASCAPTDRAPTSPPTSPITSTSSKEGSTGSSTSGAPTTTDTSRG